MTSLTLLLCGFGAGICLTLSIWFWNVGRHKKTSSLTKYVVFSLASVIIYTLIAIVYQWLNGQELSSTLTTCYFATMGGEVLSSALIKIFKLKEDNYE